MKKRILALLVCLGLLVGGCTGNISNTANQNQSSIESNKSSENDKNSKTIEVNPAGRNIEERIPVPEGYTRSSVKDGSFASFVRGYSLKADGSKVLLYNGTPKGSQSDHVAVFDLPIEAKDLQQCADSIMRIYGEYYYSLGAYDKIKFPMGGGFIGDFNKWRQGNKIALDGNNLYWVHDAKNNSSYDSFVKFMQVVFMYSGTQNMSAASKAISLNEANIGDIFIKGGSPGHVVMIVDVCENTDGNKAFLLGQGYMPAQDFHVIKNPLHEEDPWYYEEEITYPLRTAEYTFPTECLKRLDW